jgi:hypothetical protein
LVGKSDETVDRRFNLGTHEANVSQCAVVEFAKARDGGATDEIARDTFAAGAEKPSECTRPLRDRGRDED